MNIPLKCREAVREKVPQKHQHTVHITAQTESQNKPFQFSERGVLTISFLIIIIHGNNFPYTLPLLRPIEGELFTFCTPSEKELFANVDFYGNFNECKMRVLKTR